MKLKLLIMTLALAFLSIGQANAKPLSESEIRQTIIGKRILLKVPFGGEFPLKYQRNGIVRGDGRGFGVGRFFSPTDQGKWWIANNQLCQQWTEWYEGRKFCFKLSDLRGDKFTWLRDDGRKGKARIE